MRFIGSGAIALTFQLDLRRTGVWSPNSRSCEHGGIVFVVGATRQGIRDNILDARDVLDRIVELGELLDPASESSCEIRHRAVILDRVVVSEQSKRLIAVQVLTPVTAGIDDGEELFLTHIVVDLSWGQLARAIRDRLQAVALVLLQSGTHCVVAGVAVERVRQGGVGDEQHGSGAERFLQLDKRFLLCVSPGKLHLVLGQFGQRQGDEAVVLHEAAIEVGEAEKGANLSLVLARWPVADSVDLVLRHGESVRANLMAEDFHLVAKELALCNSTRWRRAEKVLIVVSLRHSFVCSTLVPCASRSLDPRIAQLSLCYIGFGVQASSGAPSAGEQNQAAERGARSDIRAEAAAAAATAATAKPR